MPKSAEKPDKAPKVHADEVFRVSAFLIQRKGAVEIARETGIPLDRVEHVIQRMQKGATLDLTKDHLVGVLTPAVTGLLTIALQKVGEALTRVPGPEEEPISHNQLQRYTETLLRAAVILTAMRRNGVGSSGGGITLAPPKTKGKTIPAVPVPPQKPAEDLSKTGGLRLVSVA